MNLLCSGAANPYTRQQLFALGPFKSFLPLESINACKAGTPACSKSISHATGRKASFQILLKATGGLPCQGFGAAPAW